MTPVFASRRSNDHRAESGLPQGSPAGRGVSLDPNIPGTQTFAKPVDDIRNPEHNDETIYRVDGPDDMSKDRSRVDVNEDSAGASVSYTGHGSPDDSSKTRYPYRDDKPNAHNASAKFVFERWLCEHASTRPVLAGVRVSATLDEIVSGLNPDIQQKAKACNVTLKRADVPNLRWIFAVNCGNGPKVVRMKASRRGNTVAFPKLDLHVACSCPAWQWQGPEHHATSGDYQDPKTSLQGTASVPVIRDPEGVNLVCKHVAAAISFTRAWTLPKKKG